MSKSNYKESLSLNIPIEEIGDAFLSIYTSIGLAHGKRIGRAINSEIRQEKNFNPETFEGSYRDFVRNWLLNNAGTKITSVREELIETLIKFITDRIEQGQDIRTTSRELQKHILSSKNHGPNTNIPRGNLRVPHAPPRE